MVDKSGERFYEAELYRLRGELTLAQSRVQSLESGVQGNQKAKGKSQETVVSSQQSVVSREKEEKQRPKVTDPRPLTPDPQEEAEACFLKAIEIAQKQQAKSLELRATMSLVRLRQQQATQHGSRTTLHEAHTMLSEVYNWFTEGFDTKDLQEAKALLDSLVSSV